jgi:hypothetical protein
LSIIPSWLNKWWHLSKKNLKISVLHDYIIYNRCIQKVFAQYMTC